jgi:hypothetical protein
VQGSDQIRQAFSKRKKGLVLKAYQLNALTDAKVGSSCAAGSSSSLQEQAGEHEQLLLAGYRLSASFTCTLRM